MQERIKLAPSQAHTYNNPAVNHLFVQTRVTTTIPVTGASAGVALAMPWQFQTRKNTTIETVLLFVCFLQTYSQEFRAVQQIHFSCSITCISNKVQTFKNSDKSLH